MKSCSIVVACTHDGGIASQGSIPWNLPSDLIFFRQLTSTTSSPDKQNACIMGKSTFFSLKKPLSKRLNVVLTKSPQDLPSIVQSASSLQVALDDLSKRNDIESIFVIGGENVYREAIEHPAFTKLYMTRIVGTDAIRLKCDRFFPLHYGAYFYLIVHLCNVPTEQENGIDFKRIVFLRK